MEIWVGNRVTKELHVPKKLHGSIFNDGWFGTGAAWNADESRVAYVAEVRAAVCQRAAQHVHALAPSTLVAVRCVAFFASLQHQITYQQCLQPIFCSDACCSCCHTRFYNQMEGCLPFLPL